MDFKCGLLQVLILLVLGSHEVEGDYWSVWSDWSECSRTCDGGATYQIRRCVRSRRLIRSCKGDVIKYSTCNNKPCPRGSTDFRSEQCAAHDDQNSFLKWIPYHDSDSPCALYCRVRGSNRVRKFAPKVLDGTRCKRKGFDMCINGQCWPVGCDHRLRSKLKVDRCGVCGGNNTCASRRRGKRYTWTEFGYGACSATCGVGYKESRIHCLDNLRKEMVPDKKCRSRRRPRKLRRPCVISGKCEPRWRVGPWHACTQTCGGGFSVRNIVCAETLPDGKQRLLDSIECKGQQPSTRKSCSNVICPTWHAGEWTPCSVSCGEGRQEREVVCRHVGKDFCVLHQKPTTTRTCTTNITCRRNGADRQEVMIGLQSDDTATVNDVLFDENLDEFVPDEPSYVVSPWGPCSATCGEGVKERTVMCKVYLPFLESVMDLAEEECRDTPMPPATQICRLAPCLDHFEYRAMGMTSCSQSCLGGVQETVLKCVHKSNGSIALEQFCSEAQAPPTERRVCNDIPCPQKWQIGDFGQCSQTCGNGVMRRDVICTQAYADGEDDFLVLPDIMCSKPVPQKQRPCNRIDCQPVWFTGNWSKCSVTCGDGVKSRGIFCVRTLRSGQSINVSFTDCGRLPQPGRYKECNMTKCPQPEIRQIDVNFFQLNKIKKVRLSMGMKAFVLPGTTIIIKCGTKGVDRKQIMWYKDGHHILLTKRIKLTHSYALKIKKSRHNEDRGIYTCKVASIQASLRVNFITVYDLFQATVLRETYLSGLISDASLLNSTSKKKDPIDRGVKPLYLVKTPWNGCSVTCGGGLQARNVSCEIISTNYYLVFPIKYCTKSGNKQPSVIQSCNNEPCVHWKIGEWSKCTTRACHRNMFALQSRSIECVSEMEEVEVNSTHCDSMGAVPISSRECINTNCTARWNTSDWSQCMGPCGASGYKARMLSCIWSDTGLPAYRNCESLRRPRTRKGCNTKPCSASCTDESNYCSVVKLMNLCKLGSFKKKCCKSCS